MALRGHYTPMCGFLKLGYVPAAQGGQLSIQQPILRKCDRWEPSIRLDESQQCRFQEQSQPYD